MRLKLLALGLALVTAVPAAVTAAQAEDGIYIPLMSYRTGPYSGAGIAIFNGMHDYLNMLNARDGGIGGARLIVEECETGYDTKKGVECYDATKGKNPVVSTPYSTGITLQLIPKAAVDKIPVLSMAYGLSASADGNDFPWVFNPPATYWDGASAFVRHVADVEGGFDKLKGKTIGLVHLDAPYGKEPIPLLEALAKDYGFTLKLYPVPGAQMQNQTSLWLDVRRDRPDWIFMQGWGAMNPTALKEAVKVNLPNGSLHWELVGRRRGRCAPGGPGGERLFGPRLQRGRSELSPRSRTSSNTSSTRGTPRPRRKRSARFSITAAS